MTLSGLLAQMLNGLASASTLFLLASGLSLIFGVSRIVNFAHGSLCMIGAYIAWTLTTRLSGALGFWAAMIFSALGVAMIGALIEICLLRRIYRAPELFQLLATFAIALIVRDVILLIWGAEDLLGPRAPGLSGSVEIFGRRFPQYDLFLIAVGPLVLGCLWALLNRTRWGALARATAQDREMASALGVDASFVFTSVFALGAGLAGLSGALQLPREPANLGLDAVAIGDAFVVVVVGGLGSLPGAFAAALLISEMKALCVGLGQWDTPFGLISFPKLTLAAEFLIMAIVLVVRPWGLMGRPQAPTRGALERFWPPPPKNFKFFAFGALLIVALIPILADPRAYILVLSIDIFIAIIFAASLHFIAGPGGLHSFGHAAYFGLGAYAAALFFKNVGASMALSLPMSILGGGLGGLIFGWFCVRLSGVYFAMLTLAFGQILWSIAYQWDGVTGGSNGLVGVWPSPEFASKPAYYYLAMACCALALVFLRRALFSPFGYALRASRDCALRAAAIGLNVPRLQWAAFTIAGGLSGLAGGLYVFSKGGASPDVLGVNRSIDGLTMVLLGGVETLSGPIVGAAAMVFLQDSIARHFEYWRAALGLLILGLVLAAPYGIVGAIRAGFDRRR